MSSYRFASDSIPDQQYPSAHPDQLGQVIDLGSSSDTDERREAKVKSKKARKNRRGPNSRKKKNKKDGPGSETGDSASASAGRKPSLPVLSSSASTATVDTILLEDRDGIDLPRVPVLPRFELQETGIGGHIVEAAYAADFIEAGARLICETPVIAVRDILNVDSIYAGYERLSPQDQDAIWQLPTAYPQHLRPLEEAIDRAIDLIETLYAKGNSGRTKGEEDELDLLEERLEVLIVAWRVAARFAVHATRLHNLPIEELLKVPDSEPLVGLFPLFSKLQHSCIPNCYQAFNDSLGKMTVHAIRDIHDGEPLTISHLGTEIWYNNQAERARLLRRVNCPPCNCPACDTTHPEFEAHERARNEAAGRAHWLSQIMTRFDAGSHNKNRYRKPFGLAGADEPNQYELVGMEKMCLDLIGFLRKAGCEDNELVRWKQLIVNIFCKAKPKDALRHARTNVSAAVKCFGADSPELEELKEVVKALGGLDGWVEVGANGVRIEKRKKD